MSKDQVKLVCQIKPPVKRLLKQRADERERSINYVVNEILNKWYECENS